MGHDVFVSFKSDDKEIAERICDDLGKRGITCWISSRNIRSGTIYQAAIVDALKEAAVIVLVFSSAANQSQEIIKELSLASRFKKLVMPVRIEDFEPDSGPLAYEMSSPQRIDLFANWEKEIDHLAEDIKFNLSAKTSNGNVCDSNKIPAGDTTTERLTANQSPDKGAVETKAAVSWPDVGYEFLNAVYKNVDLARLPFTVPSDDLLEGEDLAEAIHDDERVYWVVNSKSSFGVLLDAKNIQKGKIDVCWGFYSAYEKRDPVFRKACDEIYNIKELLNEDEEVEINGYTYEFADTLGFEAVEHVNLSELGEQTFRNQVAEQLIALANKIWPVIEKHYGATLDK